MDGMFKMRRDDDPRVIQSLLDLIKEDGHEITICGSDGSYSIRCKAKDGSTTTSKGSYLLPLLLATAEALSVNVSSIIPQR
ncbi:MAG: hypothetical protein JXB13_23000 [Phycisphaerae bacterium]|nr:hypothetical protein [Phycisphaerae bacterium]